jgi:histidyl-tRNA synthetase
MSTEEMKQKLLEIGEKIKAIDEKLLSYESYTIALKNAIKAFEKEIEFEVYATGMGNENLSYAVSVLNSLRDENIASVAYLEAEKKFKNQIEYADKINAKFSMIIGETEKQNQIVALKNMTTGEQVSVSVADAIKNIKAI